MRMILRRKRWAAVLPACALVLGAQGWCWGGSIIVHRFDLQSCPASTFSLPDTISDPPLRVVARGSSPSYRLCHGFTTYESREGVFGMRLRRGPQCTLDIGYRNLVPGGGNPERLRRLEDEQRRQAEYLAGVVAQRASVAAGTPAQPMRFERLEHLHAWCERTSDPAGASGTNRPSFGSPSAHTAADR